MTSDVGPRLRAARMQRGESLRTVASALGVSASLVSQVETGKTQPSVSTLYALANHLGLSLDDVLGTDGARSSVTSAVDTTHAAAEAEPRPAVQRAAENLVLDMENGVRWERLATHMGGKVTPVLVTYEPGGSSSVEGKLMRHEGYEYAYLIEGSLLFHLEFDKIELEAGDSLQFDGSRPHMYSNEGDVPARGIWFVIGRSPQPATATGGDRTSARGPQGDGSVSSAVDVLMAMDTHEQ